MQLTETILLAKTLQGDVELASRHHSRNLLDDAAEGGGVFVNTKLEQRIPELLRHADEHRERVGDHVGHRPMLALGELADERGERLVENSRKRTRLSSVTYRNTLFLYTAASRKTQQAVQRVRRAA